MKEEPTADTTAPCAAEPIATNADGFKKKYTAASKKAKRQRGGKQQVEADKPQEDNRKRYDLTDRTSAEFETYYKLQKIVDGGWPTVRGGGGGRLRPGASRG
eukprot:GHVU01118034.1.p3 GENE.GHVU01118034.1~~GHVU01118034.1.p3  ORF type:complete len:102 (-),score=22.48 GHVU01118034.1:1018-1323(-)